MLSGDKVCATVTLNTDNNKNKKNKEEAAHERVEIVACIYPPSADDLLNARWTQIEITKKARRMHTHSSLRKKFRHSLAQTHMHLALRHNENDMQKPNQKQQQKN